MPEKTVQKESGKKPVPSKKPKPQQEVVVQIPLSELHPFPDHPFQVREDASMQETAESVKEYGVLVPALARPREDGGYELIAGHRRKHACELAGLATMPVIVRNIDRDAATIIMVDSNLQRENILPSERAKAYKMKMEAIKRQGARTDLTSPKISAKFRSDDEVGQDMGIELSPPAFTTPLGYTYHIGDCISSIELDHIAAVGVIARVDEDHVWHTLPNVPGQEPVSIDRNSFERYLDTRYFEVSEPEPQRVIAAQHTEQPTPETPQAVQNLMGQRVEIDGKLYNVDSADETVAHLSVVSSSSESNHDPEHRTEPVSAVLTRIADQGRELAPNISAYQALRAEHPEKLIGVRVGERLLFYGADDLAVGNVPFGQYQVDDRAYNKLGFSIHDYFFAKTLDQVRPGGVIAFVTSRYTMDKQSPEVRRYIAQRAELLGAIRLPNNAFRANAGTDVVSDILFLQKRDRPIEIEPDWVHLGQNEDGFAINRYFVDHPEMILGRQTSESTQYGKQDFTVVPIEGLALADQLHDAVKNIRGTYQEAELPELGEGEQIDTSIPADPNVKNYSYTVVDDEVYYRENSRMVKPELNATVAERVKGMVALRDCVNELIALQMDEYSAESRIQEAQTELNRLYDAFSAKHGLINDRANRLAFSDDSSYYLLCSLEVLDDDGKLERKADMFHKRTIKQQRSVDSVDTASEALAVCIGEKACVDLDFMSSLMGGSEKIPQIVEDLKGVIYKEPNSGPFDLQDGGVHWAKGWQTADEYLSGNVRQKLRTAQRVAAHDPFFAGNVDALIAAQPKDLEASEIEVRLGVTWLDKKYIEQFMYERLSRDDDLSGESNSITNQKKYLEDYAQKNGYTNIRHFTDDGYSGVNFNRPGFQAMISEIEAGNVETLIVKDMSRLGRNYLQVGFYTEILFPQKKVHFLAINNSIDSNKASDNDFAPFLNIMNEWYAKDTSNKIRSVFDARMKDGKRCSGSIPYGYNRVPSDKQALVVDPVAAEVVKRIFLLANEGKSTRAIAEKLTEEKVLIPSAYAKEYHPEQYNGQKYSNPNLWGMSTVRGILERQEYLGHTVLRKTVGTNFKLHKRKSTAQDEQYLFQNTHEPIISQELWDSVHRRRKRVQRASAWGSHTNRLSGYLYCADCGRRLTLQTHYSKKDGSVQYSYRCGGYASRVNSCTAHSISADNVEALVLSSVKRFSRFVLQDENAFAAELQSLWIERLKTEPKNQQSELQRCQKRYDELSNLVRGLYENLMLGLLSERQYRQLMKQYDVEQTDLETKMDAIKSALAEEREKSGDIKQFIALIRKCKNPTEISDLMFYELIDKIVVYEAEGVSRARTQKVDIYFNYVGQVNIDNTPEEVAEIQAQEAQTAAERLQKQRAREKACREKRKAERLAANGGEFVKKQVCPQCGKIFIPASSHQTFCSEGCCYQARQDQKQAEREAERGQHYYRQRICAMCGSTYWPGSSRSKFCSDACRKKNHNKVTLEAYHKKRVKEQTLWKSTSPVNIQT